MVVITGANGAGKTNLLEAVSLLVPGRGLRGVEFNHLSRGGPEAGRHWAVSARISHPDGATSIGTGLDPAPVTTPGGRASRIVRMEGETVPVARLGDVMAAIWLTPAHDGLFTGPEGDRRRFFDRLTATILPNHTSHINAFEKLTRQRNRLLDDANPDKAWLSALERDMAAHAVAIADARLYVLSRLSRAEAERQAENALFPPLGIAVQGSVEMDMGEGSATAAEDAYRDRLQHARHKDAAAGRTLDGPHRSTLVITHLHKNMPAAVCSTGEQKALLVGLTLAHARILRAEKNGRMPVLLLDEITAHLDDVRREALFDTVRQLGGQALMTGTDRRAFAPLEESAQTVDVADAVLSDW